MKKICWVVLLAIIVVLVTAMPALAAPPADNPGKGPMDKIIFVHYPKHEAARSSPAARGIGVLCPDYKYTGIHWAKPTVSFSVNPDGSGFNTDDPIIAVQASFATWSNAGSSLQFVYGGTTSAEAGINDGLNAVSWADISKQFPNAIAVTSVWYFRYSKEIAEVDTQMNNGNGFSWSYTIPNSTTGYADPDNPGITGTYDIRNIMTHEAGHWIMLGDLYNNKDSFLTMYGYGSMAELKKDTLGYGDVLGMKQAYP